MYNLTFCMPACYMCIFLQPLEFVESLVAQPDVTFKILTVGNSSVGKSCFLMRLCNNTFTAQIPPTVGE